MSKFITGQQALITIANGAINIQCLRGGLWEPAENCQAIEFLQDKFKFRVTPKLIRIGDMEIEAAETEAPPVGTKYYVPSLSNENLKMDFTWRNTVYDIDNLKRRLINLSPENAVAQAKAMILASGGSFDEASLTTPDPDVDPFSDVDMDEPPPVLEHEDKPATEKKRRTNRKTAAVEPVADLPVEAVPVDTVEPEPETPADFVTPEAGQFDEPKPEDLEPVQPDRMDILLENVKTAKTGADIMNLRLRYMQGLTPDELATIESAMAQRTRELMNFTPTAPAAVAMPEKLSLAERINACQSWSELAALVPEMDVLNHQIAGPMGLLYEKRRQEILATRKNNEEGNHNG